MSGRKLENRALTPIVLKEMLSGVPPGHIGAMKVSEDKGQKNGRKTRGSGAKKKQGRKRVDKTITEVQKQGRNTKN